MSAISSLSVWSSVKILSPAYYGRKWKETKSSVPYVGSTKQINLKSKSQTTREVVHLRVPSPFRKRQESSSPDMTSFRRNVHQRKLSKRSQNISCLCVPKHDSTNLELQDIFCVNNRPSSEDGDCDESNLSSEENFPDDRMKFDVIPTVKPCTKDELKVLKKRHQSVGKKPMVATEHKKTKETKVKITKSKQTAPRTPNKSSSLDSHKFRTSLTQNFRKDLDAGKFHDLFSPMRPTGRNYYEKKLAELYVIKLGIKR